MCPGSEDGSPSGALHPSVTSSPFTYGKSTDPDLRSHPMLCGLQQNP